jgi:pyruvate dehydrogenase E2 component (dihydrolipoamide acetyltransferase)
MKASPLAKKIAAELGVDLASVAGTGPSGRIVQKDVVAAGAGSGSKVVAVGTPAVPVKATPAFAAVAATAEDTVFKLNKIRQITAKRTQESKQQVPHFYVTVEVDVERIMQLREMFKAEDSGNVSINDFVVKASALALQDMPLVNSVFQGDHLLQHGGVHIGIAVALEDGLTVPVVKNANLKPIRQLSAEVKDLAFKAKSNKLGMDELTGSTFSISNMGMLDVDTFLAIVNQPNAAIVAIASVRKKVVVGDDDEVEIRHRMNITGSFDHRVADGAVGARFINLIKGYLENPTRLLSSFFGSDFDSLDSPLPGSFLLPGLSQYWRGYNCCPPEAKLNHYPHPAPPAPAALGGVGN